MSLASSGFAFQWSRWNSEVSRSKVVLRVAQPSLTSATSVTSSDDLSWTTYLAGRKSYKLKVTEDSEEFCMDMQDGCEVRNRMPLIRTILCTDPVYTPSSSLCVMFNYNGRCWFLWLTYFFSWFHPVSLDIALVCICLHVTFRIAATLRQNQISTSHTYGRLIEHNWGTTLFVASCLMLATKA